VPNIRREVHYEGRIVPSFAERPADLDSMFRASVKRAPSSIAVVEGDRRITYAELSATVDRIAGNLSRLGIARGDRVAVLLGNRIAFVEISLACTRIGAIQVPINIRQRKLENEYVLAHSGAVALIHEADLVDQIPDAQSIPELRHRFAVGAKAAGSESYEALLAPSQPPALGMVAEDDPFCILYTSGTTGRPKGAILTHFGAVHSCLNYIRAFGLREGERSILAVPASHVTGVIAIIHSTICVAGRVLIMPVFKARAFLELAAAEKGTYTLIVPAMYNLCLLDPQFDQFDLSAWRVGGYGGAPMPEATVKKLAEKLPGLVLFNIYGATETTSPVVIMPAGEGVRLARCCPVAISGS
jgi:long-chain acyl-CoA synthetase